MDTPSSISPQEHALAQIVVALGAAAEMTGLHNGSKESDKQKLAVDQGREAIQHLLQQELERDPQIGRTWLPNGKSWIKGLQDISTDLALWWAKNAFNAWTPGDPGVTLGLNACEELMFHQTVQDRRNISPAFSHLIEIGVPHGISLTQGEADGWVYPLSEARIKRAERAKAFIDRLVEYSRTHPDKEQLPLLRAYVAADGPLAIALPGQAGSIGERPQLTAIHAVQTGYPMDRQAVGKPGGYWWETCLHKFPPQHRLELLEQAKNQGLDTTAGGKTHLYRAAKEAYSTYVDEPKRSLAAMTSYLLQSPDGLMSTTNEGDLVWQRVVSESMGLDGLYDHANDFPELDWAAHTATSSLFSCAAKFGGLSQVQTPDTLRNLIALSPVVHDPKQPPLLSSLATFMDRGVKGELKDELSQHMSQHTDQWLGNQDQQRQIACDALRMRVSAGWMMEAVPAIVALEGVSPELVWSAKLVSDCNPGHPHADTMPAQWPVRVQPMDAEWLDLARAYAAKNRPAALDNQERWLADFQAIEIATTAPPINHNARNRARL